MMDESEKVLCPFCGEYCGLDSLVQHIQRCSEYGPRLLAANSPETVLDATLNTVKQACTLKRPLTLDEFNAKKKPCWVWNEWRTGQVQETIATAALQDRFHAYGRVFRFWGKFPTESERAEAKWEDE